ncbi:MAG: ATP-binding cassette domain-containing protein [Spirochaetota bacterium]
MMTQNAMGTLEVSDLSYSYIGRKLLSGIYLKCRIGDVIGVLGRNGAGKSTLLRTIYGMLPEAFKHVLINGSYFNTPFLSGKIAYCPQENFIPEHMRLSEAASFLSRELAASLKADARISSLWQHRFGSLSGGEKKYFEVLFLLHSPAEFILLDEPFTGISPIYQQDIIRTLTQWRTEKGFIITDHDYRTLMEVTTSRMIIITGSLHAFKSEADLRRYGYLPTGKIRREHRHAK